MPHSISIKSHLHEIREKRKKTKIQSSGNSLNLSRITNNKKRINKQQTAAAIQQKTRNDSFLYVYLTTQPSHVLCDKHLLVHASLTRL